MNVENSQNDLEWESGRLRQVLGWKCEILDRNNNRRQQIDNDLKFQGGNLKKYILGYLSEGRPKLA